MITSIPVEDYVALRQLLIATRKKAGLTQQSLADRLQVPQSFVAKYEIGERRLDVLEFVAVSDALDSDPVEVIQRLVELVGPQR